ncbi:MAG: YaeQ family protein [Pseudohongiellaceae bacterium]|nr:YaeQ family protein [Pseudohongiellaceae bacterium]
MATNATIVKLALSVSDMNRHYYNSHNLTIALHPSETPERLMVRVLAFALHASNSLSFTKGISTDDEPDLWDKDLSDVIKLWVELGQPDEKRIKKASGRAEDVVIYTFQARNSEPWWKKNQKALERFDKLSVVRVDTISETKIAQLFERNMDIQCSIDSDSVYMRSQNHEVELKLFPLKEKAS